MAQQAEVDEIIAKFPGPITLRGSLFTGWFLIVVGSAMTAFGFFALVKTLLYHPSQIEESPLAFCFLVFCILLIGITPVVGIIFLRRAALTLDEDSLRFSGVFYKQYDWSEVSDFSVYRGRSAAVVFKTTRSSSVIEGLNAFLTGGRNSYLPDTYGLGARQMVRLMENWRSLAISKRAT